MPRKGSVPKRDVLPDPIYGSKLITRIVNTIMEDGKKGTAQSILYNALKRVEDQTGRNPLDVFNEAINNVSPNLEVRARRIGGQNYQVPSEVRPARKQALALRWLVLYAQKRNEKTMEEKLAKEIMDAATGVGAAVKKREETHRMAEANKAFAHYRF